MANKENNIIEFEGIKIKPTKSGYYKCPFGCHTNSSYPQPKWKTEKGFRKHLECCFMKPSEVEKRDIEKKKKDNEQLERNNILETLIPEFLEKIEYKIGDEISYVQKVIVKDTHEWKGDRHIRVRYEPILRYDAINTTIRSIHFRESDIIPTIENIRNLVYFNFSSDIRLSIIVKKHEAQKIAKDNTEKDEQYRNECSMLR